MNRHENCRVLSDFCDGQVYKSHPLFSVDLSSLQIFFYFDDLEVCNPLGSKAKIHKISELCRYYTYSKPDNIFDLGIFYISLGNMPPKCRSQLSAIYLVAIAHHRNLVKYGMDSILRPFVEDMKKLVFKGDNV